MLNIHCITYQTDSSNLFHAIRDLPYACWLDSGKPQCSNGRYDILTACPTERYVTRGQSTSIYHCNFVEGGDRLIEQREENPFAIIESAVSKLACEDKRLPFIGGAIGYLGYDLAGHSMDTVLPAVAENKCHLPDMHMGIYHWAIIQDHDKQQSVIVSLPSCNPSLLQIIKKRLEKIPADSITKHSQQEIEKSFIISDLHSNMNVKSYIKTLDKIDDYIHAGDCYQINIAQCFSAKYRGDPYWAYQKLRRSMASPYSAYLSMDDQHILCLSPERFITITDRQVITQPIKGTAPRHRDPIIDRQLAEDLQHSEKNRAENIMIVDLLRNDLGKTCIPGSISVDKLFDLESFPNVHHLVSTIRGVIDNRYSALDTLKACFPGGSITGAPKKRAMEIIEELEPYKRSAYCGSISYISANGYLDSNIVIRSVICDGQQLYCWGGGGIVADSDASDEYQESLVKIQRILDILTAT